MASPTRWTCVWVNSRSWWWTGRPGVLQFMGSQRVGHDWATELNWSLLGYFCDNILFILFLNTVSKPIFFIKILFIAPYQNHSHVFLFFYVNLSPWSWLPLFFTWTSLITSNTYTLIACYHFSIPQSIFFETKVKACHSSISDFLIIFIALEMKTKNIVFSYVLLC